MREIAARRLAASTFGRVLAENKPVVFYTGHSGRERRVIALPADWQGEVTGIYGVYDPLQLSHHTQINDDLIVRLLTEQVDAGWKPGAYAVYMVGEQEMLYIVPANPYWRELVEEANNVHSEN